MIGLTQCTIPWSSDEGSAKAASTPQPTASGTLLSEDYLQILEKLLLKGNNYSLFTWSFQALYFPSKYHTITVYEGFLPEENTQSSGPISLLLRRLDTSLWEHVLIPTRPLTTSL